MVKRIAIAAAIAGMGTFAGAAPASWSGLAVSEPTVVSVSEFSVNATVRVSARWGGAMGSNADGHLCDPVEGQAVGANESTYELPARHDSADPRSFTGEVFLRGVGRHFVRLAAPLWNMEFKSTASGWRPSCGNQWLPWLDYGIVYTPWVAVDVVDPRAAATPNAPQPSSTSGVAASTKTTLKYAEPQEPRKSRAVRAKKAVRVTIKPTKRATRTYRYQVEVLGPKKQTIIRRGVLKNGAVQKAVPVRVPASWWTKKLPVRAYIWDPAAGPLHRTADANGAFAGYAQWVFKPKKAKASSRKTGVGGFVYCSQGQAPRPGQLACADGHWVAA